MAEVVRPPETDDAALVSAWALPYFCAVGAPPPTPPTPPTPFFFPATDTIRGGAQICLPPGGLDYDDRSMDESFARLNALPASWGSVVSGTGAVTFDARGVVLDSGGEAGSWTILQAIAAFRHFDVAVDIELLGPTAVRSGVVEVGRLFFAAGDDLLALTVERDALLRVRAEATAHGRALVGQTAPLTATKFTLRLVRHGAYAYAFIGERSDRTYQTLTLLFSTTQFGAAVGFVGFRVANFTRAVQVRTRFLNFTVESHARIGDRLLIDKMLQFGRIIGAVPAATLREVGTTDLAVFGPFGTALSADGFEYTLPPVRTVGRDRNARLLLVQDKELKDGT